MRRKEGTEAGPGNESPVHTRPQPSPWAVSCPNRSLRFADPGRPWEARALCCRAPCAGSCCTCSCLPAPVGLQGAATLPSTTAPAPPPAPGPARAVPAVCTPGWQGRGRCTAPSPLSVVMHVLQFPPARGDSAGQFGPTSIVAGGLGSSRLVSRGPEGVRGSCGEGLGEPVGAGPPGEHEGRLANPWEGLSCRETQVRPGVGWAQGRGGAPGACRTFLAGPAALEAVGPCPWGSPSGQAGCLG